MKASTGLRNKMLDTGSLKSLLDGGKIKIYSGTLPATADAAIGSAGSNTLLSTITDNDTVAGLNFDTAAASGQLAKDPAQTWRGTNVASGTAAFFRFVQTADDGSSSTTAVRIQGTIASFGADLNISSVALSSGATQDIDNFIIAIPTL